MVNYQLTFYRSAWSVSRLTTALACNAQNAYYYVLVSRTVYFVGLRTLSKSFTRYYCLASPYSVVFPLLTCGRRVRPILNTAILCSFAWKASNDQVSYGGAIWVPAIKHSRNAAFLRRYNLLTYIYMPTRSTWFHKYKCTEVAESLLVTFQRTWMDLLKITRRQSLPCLYRQHFQFRRTTACHNFLIAQSDQRGAILHFKFVFLIKSIGYSLDRMFIFYVAKLILWN